MLKIAYHSCYEHPLPEGHRFPMMKYRLLYEQLLYEGLVESEHFFEPQVPDQALFYHAHDPSYVHKLHQLLLSKEEVRRTGFPLTEGLVTREFIIMEGTWRCALLALERGVAMNIAGGTHHAFRNRGSGFCLLNDIAIAATNLLERKLAHKILVVDLDVHQGDGTAAIFSDESRVFTFSMHGASNFPAKKEKSDLDIPLPDGMGDKAYLEILRKTLPELFEKVAPDFVFYQSGVDVLATDKLGKLNLSIQGCKERDETVFSLCKQGGVPVVASMGGGYSERIAHIVDAHANTFKVALSLYT